MGLQRGCWVTVDIIKILETGCLDGIRLPQKDLKMTFKTIPSFWNDIPLAWSDAGWKLVSGTDAVNIFEVSGASLLKRGYGDVICLKQ